MCIYALGSIAQHAFFVFRVRTSKKIYIYKNICIYISVLKHICVCIIIFIFRCLAGAALAPVGASQQCPITVPRQRRHSAHTHLIVRRNRRGKRSDDGAREPEWSTQTGPGQVLGANPLRRSRDHVGWWADALHSQRTSNRPQEVASSINMFIYIYTHMYIYVYI